LTVWLFFKKASPVELSASQDLRQRSSAGKDGGGAGNGDGGDGGGGTVVAPALIQP
jgi:hypothetical protein